MQRRMTGTLMPEPSRFWEVPPDDVAPAVTNTPTPKRATAADLRQAAERRCQVHERVRQALAGTSLPTDAPDLIPWKIVAQRAATVFAPAFYTTLRIGQYTAAALRHAGVTIETLEDLATPEAQVALAQAKVDGFALGPADPAVLHDLESEQAKTLTTLFAQNEAYRRQAGMLLLIEAWASLVPNNSDEIDAAVTTRLTDRLAEPDGWGFLISAFGASEHFGKGTRHSSSIMDELCRLRIGVVGLLTQHAALRCRRHLIVGVENERLLAGLEERRNQDNGRLITRVADSVQNVCVEERRVAGGEGGLCTGRERLRRGGGVAVGRARDLHGPFQHRGAERPGLDIPNLGAGVAVGADEAARVDGRADEDQRLLRRHWLSAATENLEGDSLEGRHVVGRRGGLLCLSTKQTEAEHDEQKDKEHTNGTGNRRHSLLGSLRP